MARAQSGIRRSGKVLLRGGAVGAFWSAIWLTTYSWPVLFAAIWLVIALTNPRRTPTFPGLYWVLCVRDLWRGTQRVRMAGKVANYTEEPA